MGWKMFAEASKGAEASKKARTLSGSMLAGLDRSLCSSKNN